MPSYYTTRHWFSLFDLVGRPELQADPRFQDFASRREHIDVLYGLLAEALTQRTTSDWLAEFERIDIPAVKVNTVMDLLSDPHLIATSFFRSTEQEGGRFMHMAAPTRWCGRDFPHPAPAPVLAQHSREILRESGRDASDIEALAREGVTELEGRS